MASLIGNLTPGVKPIITTLGSDVNLTDGASQQLTLGFLVSEGETWVAEAAIRYKIAALGTTMTFGCPQPAPATYTTISSEGCLYYNDFACKQMNGLYTLSTTVSDGGAAVSIANANIYYLVRFSLIVTGVSGFTGLTYTAQSNGGTATIGAASVVYGLRLAKP